MCVYSTLKCTLKPKVCHRKMSAFKMSENRQWIVLSEDKSKRNVPVQILIEKGLQKLKHKMEICHKKYICFKMNAKNADDQFIIIQHFVFNCYLTVSIWEPADNLCSTVIWFYLLPCSVDLFNRFIHDLEIYGKYDLLITENVEASNICMAEYFLWGRFIVFSHSALNHDNLLSLLHVYTCIWIFCCYHC